MFVKQPLLNVICADEGKIGRKNDNVGRKPLKRIKDYEKRSIGENLERREKMKYDMSEAENERRHHERREKQNRREDYDKKKVSEWENVAIWRKRRPQQIQQDREGNER